MTMKPWRESMRHCAGTLLLACVVLLAAPGMTAFQSSQQGSFQAKLDQIAHNEDSPGPWSNVTLTAPEVNAWFAGAGAKKLPKGVHHLILSSEPGTITGNAIINFDEIEGSKQDNPLLGLFFSGTHQVVARAHVDSEVAPAAKLTVDWVSLDGHRIPNAMIDLAVDTFIHPTHPDIGRTFQVSLPDHVKSANLGVNQVILQY